jgi:hypothetical protein
VVDTLILSLRETISPIPLQTFWGSELYVNPACDIRGEYDIRGE